MNIDLGFILEQNIGKIIGVLLTFSFSGFALAILVIKKLFTLKELEKENIKKVLAELSEKINFVRKEDAHGQQKLELAIQGFRAELHLTAQKVDVVKEALLKLEGGLSLQQKTIQDHIEKIARIDSKLDAVFRFIDAKPRATDDKRSN